MLSFHFQLDFSCVFSDNPAFGRITLDKMSEGGDSEPPKVFTKSDVDVVSESLYSSAIGLGLGDVRKSDRDKVFTQVGYFKTLFYCI